MQSRPLPAAVQALRHAEVRKVYADHGVGARLAEAAQEALTILPANLRIDAYGHAPDPNLLPRFRVGRDMGVAYPRSLPSAESIEATLSMAGWGFTSREVGGYRLLTRFVRPQVPGTPLPRRGWTASGSAQGSDPAALFDGQLNTAWSTRRPQAPGAWLRLDLAEPALVTALALDLGPFRFDYPRGLRLQASQDGIHWEVVQTTPLLMGPLRWMGTHFLRDGVDRVVLRFSPLRARSLRLSLTGTDPVFSWSVAELALLAP